ncbi:unnamed protein product [Cylindrotheca closterium]|uniref:Uncharacterized protein n=1 Tax=Cylindrotheca closterium TaxID=2856 RepID=A0AAD2FQA7_9STRA|nr:unnamed protein product [Cylindrotheca closterium]
MNASQQLAILVSTILFLQLGSSFGFRSSMSPATRMIPSTRSSKSAMYGVINEESDFPPEEGGYDSSIDWDSEWKKVVQSEGKLSTGESRPGQEFYKSEAEIAAIKAANKAAARASEAASSVTNKLPQLSSFSGDWKFWIGVLAIISVGLAVLSAPPQANILPGPSGTGGGYYI